MVDITISDFMKGKYNLMTYIGINISKLNHFLPLPFLQMAKYSSSCSEFYQAFNYA